MTPPLEVQASRTYRLIAEIGRGGMADVCLAVAQGPAGFVKLVVLKKARMELTRDPEFRSMFLDEARLAARLNHPNVVQTYEVGQDGDQYFIAMEYLDGQPLHRIRTRVGMRSFPLSMQIRILVDALAGLHHAHDLADFDGTPLGVVHRDATPQNVFVTYDGLVKMVDFGIAKAADSSSETRAGVLKGKVAYMAPEQARGERVDRRVDVFSVGVMLWEAITGERMWKGVADMGILSRLSHGRIPSLRDHTPIVDPELERICERALAVKPAERYATAEELQHDLERWLEQRGDRVTTRSVGQFIARHFAAERALIKELIEKELRGMRCPTSSPQAASVEAIPEAPVTADHPTPETLRPSSVNLDALPDLRSIWRPRRPSKAALWIGSALTVAGVSVLVAIEVLAPMPSDPTPPPAPASAPAPPPTQPGPLLSTAQAPRPAPAIAEVELIVRVWPTTAKVFLDGAPLSSGWYKGKLPKDGRVHRIRAEAPHFIAKEQPIIASRDLLLTLALDLESKDAGGP